MDKKKQLHSGHRQRIKTKFKKFGLSVFEEHEILELLLTYCIPRKDTNPIAHALIEEFGSLTNILQADFKRLKQVAGVGEETALFLNLLDKVLDFYLSKNKTESFTITSPETSVKYFRNHYRIKKNESFIGLCLNNKGTIVDHFCLEGESENEIKFSVEFLAQYLSKNAVKQLVIFHTHPNGNVTPTNEDNETTKRIFLLCAPFGVEFKDHIIINNNTHYSYLANGNMDLIKQAIPNLSKLSKLESLVPTKK